MSRPFELLFSQGVLADIKGLRAYDRENVLDTIEAQLAYTPTVETKKRKLLRNFVPPFEAILPIWQLRVGEFRVFYDVDEHEQKVYIRAIREKPAHMKTEEIL